MASGDGIYVDTSALRSLYIHDDRSARFCGWRRRIGGSLPLTRFGRAELLNSFALAIHHKLSTKAQATGAASDLDADIESGRLRLTDVLWRRTLTLSAELSTLHTPRLGTRTLDVLHVATAISLGAKRFVTYDERQSALAEAAGLRVLAP